MVKKIELEQKDKSTSVEQSIKTAQTIQNIVQYMISRENLLIITQDAKTKNERFLCLTVNIDHNNIASRIQGSTEVMNT